MLRSVRRGNLKEVGACVMGLGVVSLMVSYLDYDRLYRDLRFRTTWANHLLTNEQSPHRRGRKLKSSDPVLVTAAPHSREHVEKQILHTVAEPNFDVDSLSEIYQEKHINCARTFAGKKIAIEEAVKKTSELAENNVGVLDTDFYLKATKDCHNFIGSRGYITSSLSAEEANFSIAYSILAFKHIEMFERLLRSIYRPEHFMCVHIDIKADSHYFKAVEGIVNCFPNVFLAPKRVDVRWGQFSVLEPELICMEALWAHKSWKYFINLTGQEFPLKTNAELVKIFTAYNGANDVACAPK